MPDKTKQFHFAGYDFVSRPKGTKIHRRAIIYNDANLTLAQLRVGVKKVITITVSRSSISGLADPFTELRMQRCRKFYEIYRRNGIGWYLPARVVSKLSQFPQASVCAVVPVTLVELNEDSDHEPYELQIRWPRGKYRFALIREDSWYQ